MDTTLTFDHRANLDYLQRVPFFGHEEGDNA